MGLNEQKRVVDGRTFRSDLLVSAAAAIEQLDDLDDPCLQVPERLWVALEVLRADVARGELNVEDKR